MARFIRLGFQDAVPGRPDAQIAVAIVLQVYPAMGADIPVLTARTWRHGSPGRESRGPGIHSSATPIYRNLLDRELKVIDAVNLIQGTWDPVAATEAGKTIQRVWTENVYTVGLMKVPAALLINKRIRNAHPGTPVFMFEWAEVGVVRERHWAPAGEQITELLPGQIPDVLNG
ncbi:MAG: hypothetical protein OXI81_14895 [Paracoccaceae bacterium]|nr:hypothetical protein [Paracoccaceae bacterium]